MSPETPRHIDPSIEQKSPESQPAPVEALSPPQQELANYWLQKIAAEEQPTVLEQTEVEKAAAELETLFDTWLSPETLAGLHALVTETEAMASPLRTEAKVALKAILERMKKLEETPERFKKYKALSRAVGIINSGLVDHTR